MSTWYSAIVSCPSCGHDFEGRFVRGANASRSAALREAALAGTLNRPACTACGKTHDTDATVVYADPERGHWIMVAHHGDLARWAEIEKAGLTAFRTSLETAVGRDFANVRVRIVFDLDELRERLIVWDADLDDAVVECVKLQCLTERPAMRGPAGRIRVVRVSPDSLVMRVIDGGNVRAEFEVSRDVAAQIAADPVWRSRFPELFQDGFVSLDRYLR